MLRAFKRPTKLMPVPASLQTCRPSPMPSDLRVQNHLKYLHMMPSHLVPAWKTTQAGACATQSCKPQVWLCMLSKDFCLFLATYLTMHGTCSADRHTSKPIILIIDGYDHCFLQPRGRHWTGITSCIHQRMMYAKISWFRSIEYLNRNSLLCLD